MAALKHTVVFALRTYADCNENLTIGLFRGLGQHGIWRRSHGRRVLLPGSPETHVEKISNFRVCVYDNPLN
jgi:hypothetical protein